MIQSFAACTCLSLMIGNFGVSASETCRCCCRDILDECLIFFEGLAGSLNVKFDLLYVDYRSCACIVTTVSTHTELQVVW